MSYERGPQGIQGATGPAGETGATGASPTLYIAQYYKSVAQNAPTGVTDVTYDLTQTWNNTGGYITHTNGTTDFVVTREGIYQLEFSLATLSNGGSWSQLGKSATIFITRGGAGTQTILTNTFNISSATNYGSQVVGTVYLLVGDVIKCSSGGYVTGGPVLITGILNTFDYNTTFTWRLLN